MHRLFSVAGVPQRIETASPWCNPALVCECDNGKETKYSSGHHARKQELLELF